MANIMIKICGITNLEDANKAIELGADAIGFMFYPPSPRYIAPEEASRIIANLNNASVIKIGVFVDEKIETVKEIFIQCSLDNIQLHGQETAEYCQNLGISKIIKAISIKNKDDIKKIKSYPFISTFLLDTKTDKLPGGTGQTFDWKIIENIKRKDMKIILAGGLSPENITEAIKIVRPYGVDISSLIESRPGKKDHLKMEEFILKARKAFISSKLKAHGSKGEKE
jgi:phosphoribosylanthranilate isomerase